MSETPREIIEEIEGYRSHLGEDLTALESRVRNATTWRTYYDRHPYLFVGTALGGGLLLSGIFRRRVGDNYRESHRTIEHSNSAVAESLDGIKAALISYGASKVKEVIGEILPGFAEHAK
jgi:hypothetical protein